MLYMHTVQRHFCCSVWMLWDCYRDHRRSQRDYLTCVVHILELCILRSLIPCFAQPTWREDVGVLCRDIEAYFQRTDAWIFVDLCYICSLKRQSDWIGGAARELGVELILDPWHLETDLTAPAQAKTRYLASGGSQPSIHPRARQKHIPTFQ